MTATEKLARLLDERGVEWKVLDGEPAWAGNDGRQYYARHEFTFAGPVGTLTLFHVTPEQAIEATLGSVPWVSPTWERWHKSLRHDEVKSIGDAVEQLMYEAIEFGGDMGPNGNAYNGIDEGDVLTDGYINKWVERFENMLGPGTCEEIVRCKDCAFSFDAGSRCNKWRDQDCFENSIPEHVEPDGFCAWACRKSQ